MGSIDKRFVPTSKGEKKQGDGVHRQARVGLYEQGIARSGEVTDPHNPESILLSKEEGGEDPINTLHQSLTPQENRERLVGLQKKEDQDERRGMDRAA